MTYITFFGGKGIGLSLIRIQINKSTFAFVMLICIFGSTVWSCSLLTVAAYICTLMRCVLIS